MDKEQIGLRSGYLLVQSPKKKWKARWFVLSEDQLCCYHKLNKISLISSLPLTGFSVTSPCNELPDTNAQGLFKLSTMDGEEVYFQSGGPEDRDGWAHALGAVIRSLSTTTQISLDKTPFQEFTAYANVSEIIGALQDPDAGISTGTHLRSGVIYKNCFKGSEIVDWLLRWSLVRNRKNGAAMAQTLLKLGHVQQISLKDGSGIIPNFSDSDKLYKFTSINLSVKRNSFYDSTDSDSSSSEDDDDDDDGEESRTKKGKPLIQAFLTKKRNLRKGWRVVKVLIQDSPRALAYYRACFASCVDDKFPSKVIPLEGSTVTEAIKTKGSASCSKLLSYRLCIRSRKGRTLTFQMKDEHEKQEWLTQLQSSQQV